MEKEEDLLEEDLVRFAVKHYYNPHGMDVDDFYDDLNKFKYVKRLVNRYLETGNLSERLILNHLIVIFNVFGIYGGLKILQLKLKDEHWPIIKPFLLFLKVIREDQFMNIRNDQIVVDVLRKI